MICHGCFLPKQIEDFSPSNHERILSGRTMHPICKKCRGKEQWQSQKMKKEANKKVSETDYEAKVYRLAKQIALDAHRGYTEADLNDVRNLLLRNIPRGEIHLHALIPRYRVTKILRDL